MNLTILHDERLAICLDCEHYRKFGHRCSKVAVPSNPTRQGFLNHTNGIRNPKTQCPIGKWSWHPSNHAIAVDAFIPIPGPVKRKITLTGITEANELEWCIALYSRSQKLGLGFKRSTILEKLREIRKSKNNYK